MNIKNFINNDKKLGMVIRGYGITSALIPPIRKLKYYSVDAETNRIIFNNLHWVRTGEGHLLFQFMYLFLPTPCNQRCKGCFMGQDKRRLPANLKGKYFSQKELDQTISFAKESGAKAVVYGGGGELFMWSGAFGLIESVVRHGLGMVIFTNGTCLSSDKIERLNSLGVVLIVSLRDTVESYHNAIVGINGFRKTIETIDAAIEIGMHRDGRLAVEMPVTVQNEDRVVNDLLPVLRAIGIVPWIEEFIQIATSEEEKLCGHSFRQARKFFQRMAAKDTELGIQWTPKFGQRMSDQTKCQRPLYSFAIFPNRDVVDCPAHSITYGNLSEESLENILRSERFRKSLLNYKLCPCSVFYTDSNAQIPEDLPGYLKEAIR